MHTAPNNELWIWLLIQHIHIFCEQTFT